MPLHEERRAELRATNRPPWWTGKLLRARTPAVRDALRSKSGGASAGSTAGEAAVRDAQQGDRDGRATLSQEESHLD